MTSLYCHILCLLPLDPALPPLYGKFLSYVGILFITELLESSLYENDTGPLTVRPFSLNIFLLYSHNPFFGDQ